MLISELMRRGFLCTHHALPWGDSWADVVSDASHQSWFMPYLELLLIVFEGFHDHTHGLHRALQPSIHPVKAVHAARHIDHQAQALGFLLGAAQLSGGTTEQACENHPWLLLQGAHKGPRVPAVGQTDRLGARRGARLTWQVERIVFQ